MRQKRSSQTSKTLLLVIVFAITTLQSLAQAPLDSINLQLRQLFGSLSRPTPPKEFNWDMAVHIMDSSAFITSNLADTLNVDDWVMMYGEMWNCAYDTAWLPKVEDVYEPCFDYGPDTINMLTMRFAWRIRY
jgi:hypothetical protein